jgi:hypothetical protein
MVVNDDLSRASNNYRASDVDVENPGSLPEIVVCGDPLF